MSSLARWLVVVQLQAWLLLGRLPSPADHIMTGENTNFAWDLAHSGLKSNSGRVLLSAHDLMEMWCVWYAPPQNLSRSSSADSPKIHRGLIKTLIKPTALYKPTRSAVPRFISNNTPQSCQPLNDFITRWTRKSVHRILITLFSLHIWKLFMCHQMAQQHEKKEKEKAKLASSGQTAVSFDVVPTITTAAWFDKKQTNTVN